MALFQIKTPLVDFILAVPSMRETRTISSSVSALHINPMSPNQLLLPRTISRRTQDIPHLLHTSKQDLPRNEKPNPLCTWWACQAPFISPKLIKILHTLQKQFMIQCRLFCSLGFIEPNHLGQLCQETVLFISWVKTNSQHGALFALFVDVDEMEFCS